MKSLLYFCKSLYEKMNKYNLHIASFCLALILLIPSLSFSQEDNGGKDVQEGGKKSFFNTVVNKIKKKNKEQNFEISNGKPEILVDKLFFDYGDVKQSDVAIAKFNITNIGSGDLKIEDVKVSCSCVEVSLSSDVIGPKDNAVLELRYNTNIVGEIKRSVTISSNAENNDNLTILLTGNVILDKRNILN